MHAQLGQIMNNKRQKTPKTQLPFLRSQEKKQDVESKAGYFVCPLNTKPPKGQGDHPSHPSGPTPLPTLILTPYKEPYKEPVGGKPTSELVACFHSPFYGRSPE